MRLKFHFWPIVPISCRLLTVSFGDKIGGYFLWAMEVTFQTLPCSDIFFVFFFFLFCGNSHNACPRRREFRLFRGAFRAHITTHFSF